MQCLPQPHRRLGWCLSTLHRRRYAAGPLLYNMMPLSVRLMPPQAHFTRSQRHVCIAGEEVVINMSTIQPYRKIIQHGG